MKTNALMDECRRRFVTPETERQVSLAVDIAERIFDILEEREMSQKDFAKLMGKTEPEVSRWLMGTHNFTIATIAKIEVALGEDLLSVYKPSVAQPIVINQTVLKNIWEEDYSKNKYSISA